MDNTIYLPTRLSGCSISMHSGATWMPFIYVCIYLFIYLHSNQSKGGWNPTGYRTSLYKLNVHIKQWWWWITINIHYYKLQCCVVTSDSLCKHVFCTRTCFTSKRHIADWSMQCIYLFILQHQSCRVQILHVGTMSHTVEDALTTHLYFPCSP